MTQRKNKSQHHKIKSNTIMEREFNVPISDKPNKIYINHPSNNNQTYMLHRNTSQDRTHVS